jgi:drug/metabolite transporter (DMT)-like permease
VDSHRHPPYPNTVPLPVFFLIVACALWGLSFPVVKALHLDQTARVPGVSSEFLAAWMQVARFGLGALMLLPFVLRHRFPRNEVRQGLLLALWGGLGMAIQADGLAYTPASTSAFLTQAYCVILPLWACLRTRSLPGRRLVIATLLVIIGGAVLSGIKPDDLRLGRGEIETLVASFIFTFQILTRTVEDYNTLTVATEKADQPMTIIGAIGTLFRAYANREGVSFDLEVKDTTSPKYAAMP